MTRDRSLLRHHRHGLQLPHVEERQQVPKVFFALLNPLTVHAQHCEPGQQIGVHPGAFCGHDVVRNTNLALVERLGLEVRRVKSLMPKQ